MRAEHKKLLARATEYVDQVRGARRLADRLEELEAAERRALFCQRIMASTPVRICGWCGDGQEPGAKEKFLEGWPATHGICPPCEATINAEIDKAAGGAK